MQKVIVKTKRVHSPDKAGYIQLFHRGEFMKMNTFVVRNSIKQSVDVKLENGTIMSVYPESVEFVDEYPEEIFIPYEQK